MKESNNKTLESLIGKVEKTNLPDWIKNTVVVCAGVTPLLEILVPLIVTGLLLKFLATLLGF